VLRADDSDETALNNLMQLYLHDFSEIDGSQISADGLFDYRPPLNLLLRDGSVRLLDLGG